MSLAPPDIDLTVLENLEQELDDEVPCESDPCKSDHSCGASFLVTHKDALPICTVFICTPCRAEALRWLKLAASINGDNSFRCKRCGMENINVNDIIVRKIYG